MLKSSNRLDPSQHTFSVFVFNSQYLLRPHQRPHLMPTALPTSSHSRPTPACWVRPVKGVTSLGPRQWTRWTRVSRTRLCTAASRNASHHPLEGQPLLTTTSNSHSLPTPRGGTTSRSGFCRHRPQASTEAAVRPPRLAEQVFHTQASHQFPSTVLKATQNTSLGRCDAGSEVMWCRTLGQEDSC